MNKFKLIITQLCKHIYPPLCVICSKVVSDYNVICETCIVNFEFTQDNVCTNCGNNLPLENHKNICDLCINKPPIFCGFKSVFIYNEPIAQLIGKFKYYDKPELKIVLGSLLKYTFAGADFKHIDLIIPIPISYFKLFTRKYNQTVLLAKELSKYTDIPLRNDILYKRKHTQAQATLKLKKRIKNVKGSFDIKQHKEKIIKNKNVLIIDDIVTTGNTLNEAAKTLKKYGANKIYVMVCARVEGEFKLYENMI